MDAVDKPRNISYKGVADLVTEWVFFFCEYDVNLNMTSLIDL